MLMLRAYMDESGHSDDPDVQVMSIGGCVAHLAAWQQFESEWKRVLEDFKVSQLHMRTFAHFQGEFENWKENQRREFLSRLMAIIDRYITAHVGAAVILSEYQRLTSEQQSELLDPYYACFQVCVRGAAIQAVGLEPRENVEVVFADHPEFGRRAFDLYTACREDLDVRNRLGPISFASPDKCVQLQAADLVAYELRLDLSNRLYRPHLSRRWPMKQLMRKTTFFDFFNHQRLAERF